MAAAAKVILGLEPHLDFSELEIRQAYRRQALRTHPDKPGGDEAAFRAVNDAYNVLTGHGNGGRKGDGDEFPKGSTAPPCRRVPRERGKASKACRAAAAAAQPEVSTFQQALLRLEEYLAEAQQMMDQASDLCSKPGSFAQCKELCTSARATISASLRHIHRRLRDCAGDELDALLGLQERFDALCPQLRVLEEGLQRSQEGAQDLLLQTAMKVEEAYASLEKVETWLPGEDERSLLALTKALALASDLHSQVLQSVKTALQNTTCLSLPDVAQQLRGLSKRAKALGKTLEQYSAEQEIKRKLVAVGKATAVVQSAEDAAKMLMKAAQDLGDVEAVNNGNTQLAQMAAEKVEKLVCEGKELLHAAERMSKDPSCADLRGRLMRVEAISSAQRKVLTAAKKSLYLRKKAEGDPQDLSHCAIVKVKQSDSCGKLARLSNATPRPRKGGSEDATLLPPPRVTKQQQVFLDIGERINEEETEEEVELSPQAAPRARTSEVEGGLLGPDEAVSENMYLAPEDEDAEEGDGFFSGLLLWLSECCWRRK